MQGIQDKVLFISGGTSGLGAEICRTFAKKGAKVVMFSPDEKAGFKMEKELKRITSEAYRTAQEVMGIADAEATAIYADAYSKDPDFYSFLQTLNLYKEKLDESSTLVLSTDSDFLKYLKEINPK